MGIVPVPAQLPATLANVDHPQAAHSLLLVGDVRFDGLAGLPGESAIAQAAPRGTRNGSMMHWPELPGTAAEDNAIKTTFELSFLGSAVKELRRDDATEMAVRRDARRCQFLHFATHGYFAA